MLESIGLLILGILATVGLMFAGWAFREWISRQIDEPIDHYGGFDDL